MSNTNRTLYFVEVFFGGRSKGGSVDLGGMGSESDWGALYEIAK